MRKLLILIFTFLGINLNVFEMYAIRDIVDQKIVSDTIFITPSNDDEFIYYPFGRFDSISKFIKSFEKYNIKITRKNIDEWKCAMLKTKNSQIRIGLYPKTEMSESDQDGYVQIFNSIIDGDLYLDRGIHVGMSKDEFIDSMQYNVSKDVLQSVGHICLESILYGVWIRFAFENNILTNIKSVFTF